MTTLLKIKSSVLYVFLTTLTISVLMGCSAAPSDIKYYQLNDTTNTGAVKKQLELSSKKYVQLATIKVPDYLKQSKLVLRTAPFEMHFSASNLWVQTPEKEIRAALLADLNSGSEQHYFVNFDPVLTKEIQHQLFIDITHFYPTENSDVLLHGFWTLTSEDGERQDHQFQFSVALSSDGYAHSVAQQRALISRLAEQIVALLRGK
jgi:uncharacterized lipoprotein YmbA